MSGTKNRKMYKCIFLEILVMTDFWQELISRTKQNKKTTQSNATQSICEFEPHFVHFIKYK